VLLVFFVEPECIEYHLQEAGIARVSEVHDANVLVHQVLAVSVALFPCLVIRSKHLDPSAAAISSRQFQLRECNLFQLRVRNRLGYQVEPHLVIEVLHVSLPSKKCLAQLVGVGPPDDKAKPALPRHFEQGRLPPDSESSHDILADVLCLQIPDEVECFRPDAIQVLGTKKGSTPAIISFDKNLL